MQVYTPIDLSRTSASHLAQFTIDFSISLSPPAQVPRTVREVEPYGMMHREGYWYAVGHCHLRGGMRLFRLHRVLGVEMLEERRARWVSTPRLRC